MGKAIKRVILLIDMVLVVIIFGIIYGIPVYTLIALKRIKIYHLERLSRLDREGRIFIINHPTLLEPPFSVLLLFLLQWPKAIIRAIKFLSFQEFSRCIPLSTPDKKNYYDPIYLVWLRPFAIAINRAEEEMAKRNRAIAFRQIIRALTEGGKSIVFPPEGGRTYKQKEKFPPSPKGNEIAKFKRGIGRLGILTGKEIIPLGFKETERILPNNKLAFFFLFVSPFLIVLKGPLKVNIGRSFRLTKELSEKEAEKIAAKALLETLDEIS